MISMEQLEELESRIIKALQLIGDLRTENAKLESDNETYKAQVEEAKLSLEEKEQEIQRIMKDLDEANNELASIKAKEEVLEKKIIEMLGKLDVLKSGSAPIPSGDSMGYSSGVNRDSGSSSAGFVSSDTSDMSGPERVDTRDDDEISVETVHEAEDSLSAGDDEDIIIIDEDESSDSDDSSVTEEAMDSSDEDEIILLEDDEDAIVIDDVDDETVIIDEADDDEGASDRVELTSEKDDNIEINENDDDEFLIIEEDKK